MSEPTSIQQFDEERAAEYDDRIRRIASGYDALHEVLVSMLETALGADAHLLVVGAGTGTEIVRMGREWPGWHFTAVDPSSDMLEQCRRRIEGTDLDGRVDYVCDRVEDLSTPQRFDGGTAVFVSHFLQEPAAKQRFFASIARRLKTDAPFVFADLYEHERGIEQLWAAWQRWLARTGASDEEVERTFERIGQEISFVPEEKLETLLMDAGFALPTRCYQCFLWGAWRTRRTRRWEAEYEVDETKA